MLVAQNKNPFTAADGQVKAKPAPGSSPVGGGFTAPAYLEQRKDNNGDGTSESTLPQPAAVAGDRVGNGQAAAKPAALVAQPVNGETPMPQVPPQKPVVPSTLPPAIVPNTQPQVNALAPQAPAPNVIPAQAPQFSPPGTPAAPALPEGFTRGTGADWGTFYHNGVRVSGFGANNASGGDAVLDDGSYVAGAQQGLQAYMDSPEFQKIQADEQAKQRAALQQPGGAGVLASTPFTPGPARYLQGGLESGANGAPVAGGYNALNDIYRQSGITPGAVNPQIMALVQQNPALIDGLPPEAAATLRATMQSQGVSLPPSRSIAPGKANDVGTPSSGSPTSSLGPSSTQAGLNATQNGGMPGPPQMMGKLGAGGGGSSDSGPYNFSTLGSLIEKLFNNPSTYDDKTMQDAISGNEAKLKTAEDQGLAGVDADTAARGLLMGSGNVIDRSKIRDQIQQKRSDFDTNIALDKAHTMAADRQQAFGNAFNFLNSGMQQQGMDFNWAQLAAQLGQQGAPDQNSALNGMPMPTPDFGNVDPQVWQVIGQLFGGSGTGAVKSPAAGDAPLPKRPTNDKNGNPMVAY